MSSAPRTKLIAAFAALYFLWGSTYLFIRWAVETLPPIGMAGVRFLNAGSVLYAWVRWRGAERPTAGQWRYDWGHPFTQTQWLPPRLGRAP